MYDKLAELTDGQLSALFGIDYPALRERIMAFAIELAKGGAPNPAIGLAMTWAAYVALHADAAHLAKLDMMRALNSKGDDDDDDSDFDDGPEPAPEPELC